MKILHTSDWHLGRAFYGRKRNDEFEAFLKWLITVVEDERADVLLIAGDIFDTGTPGNRAQELYYGFIRDISASGCRHVVAIAGNHDSPSFLDAPKGLLKVLNVHVSSAISQDASDEVLLLDDDAGAPALIVCAVPYVRDRDVRLAGAGEGSADKDGQFLTGLAEHYRSVASEAAALRTRVQAELGRKIPVVMTGHLFAAGGTPGDAERALYVGSLVQAPAEIFSPAVLDPDYVALGHLHAPQIVGKNEKIRYSGSPLPFSFSEAGGKKYVLAVDFEDGPARIKPIETPVFRRIASVKGSWNEIKDAISDLGRLDGEIWIEVIYDGAEEIDNLRALAEDEAEAAGEAGGARVEVLRVKDVRARGNILSRASSGETLGDLDPRDVFRRLLDAAEIPEHQRPLLTEAYEEALASVENGFASEAID